uniref:Zgc:158803 n=1 Tax=Petromyzon marinus TaxID=7757 RepID=S4RI13_PETMA
GDVSRQRIKFTDDVVCKSHLLDCCPHDTLAGTRMDLGDCPKTHDLALRADYEIASKKKDYFFEVDAMKHLQSFIADCDRRTEVAKKRLAETQEEISAEVSAKLVVYSNGVVSLRRYPCKTCIKEFRTLPRAGFSRESYISMRLFSVKEGKRYDCAGTRLTSLLVMTSISVYVGLLFHKLISIPPPSPVQAENVHAINEEIGKLLAKAEALGAAGNVEESQNVMDEVEKVRQRKRDAEHWHSRMPTGTTALSHIPFTAQKLRVCEVCSAYLGLHDNDRRLADHFGGKLHLGFIEIREKLQELKV